jgi:hypothetical protein
VHPNPGSQHLAKLSQPLKRSLGQLILASKSSGVSPRVLKSLVASVGEFDDAIHRKRTEGAGHWMTATMSAPKTNATAIAVSNTNRTQQVSTLYATDLPPHSEPQPTSIPLTITLSRAQPTSMPSAILSSINETVVVYTYTTDVSVSPTAIVKDNNENKEFSRRLHGRPGRHRFVDDRTGFIVNDRTEVSEGTAKSPQGRLDNQEAGFTDSSKSAERVKVDEWESGTAAQDKITGSHGSIKRPSTNELRTNNIPQEIHEFGREGGYERDGHGEHGRNRERGDIGHQLEGMNSGIEHYDNLEQDHEEALGKESRKNYSYRDGQPGSAGGNYKGTMRNSDMKNIFVSAPESEVKGEPSHRSLEFRRGGRHEIGGSAAPEQQNNKEGTTDDWNEVNLTVDLDVSDPGIKEAEAQEESADIHESNKKSRHHVDEILEEASVPELARARYHTNKNCEPRPHTTNWCWTVPEHHALRDPKRPWGIEPWHGLPIVEFPWRRHSRYREGDRLANNFGAAQKADTDSESNNPEEEGSPECDPTVENCEDNRNHDKKEHTTSEDIKLLRAQATDAHIQVRVPTVHPTSLGNSTSSFHSTRCPCLKPVPRKTDSIAAAPKAKSVEVITYTSVMPVAPTK